jgi:hypothetical protein
VALALYSGTAAVAGSTVTVYESGTLDVATLYEDIDGLVPLSNPFTADVNSGAYQFVAETAAYDVEVAQPADPPSETVPMPSEVRFNGTTPDRTATLVVEDPSTGELITLVQQRY